MKNLPWTTNNENLKSSVLGLFRPILSTLQIFGNQEDPRQDSGGNFEILLFYTNFVEAAQIKGG